MTDLVGAHGRRALAAATLAAVLLVATGARAEEPADDGAAAIPAWRAPHDRGLELYEAGQHERAAAAFEEADRLGAPAENLYNLARSHEHLERFEQALRTYDRFLAVDGVPAEHRARAEARRAALATLPARVELDSEPAGASVAVDGERTDPPRLTPTTLALVPGGHVLELELAGHQPLEHEVELAPGAVVPLTLRLARLEPTAPGAPAPAAARRGFRGGPWVLLGVGLGVAAVAVAADATAFAMTEGRTEPFARAEDYEAWERTTGDLALSGDVLLGVGLAAAAAGLVWALVTRPPRRPAPVTR